MTMDVAPDENITPPRQADKAEKKTKFDYLAMDGVGRELRGVIAAADEIEAVAKLKKQGLFPIEVWENKRKGPPVGASASHKAARGGGAASQEALGPRLLKAIGLASVIKVKFLCIFTRQLSTMLDAGLPLLLSLRTLQEQCGKSFRYRSLKKILQDIVGKVEEGVPLSEALQEHPRSFNRLYVGLVRAGEASGAMEEVLNRLAEYIEKTEKMKKKVKAGMAYPVVVLTIASCITLGLMIFIVPKFAEMFNEILEGIPLPKLTLIVISISDILVANVQYLVGGIFVSLFLIKIFLKTKVGGYLFDWLAVTLPPLNDLVMKTTVGRFCGTLGTLLDAGVPILDALQIVGQTSTNVIMRNTVAKLYNSVSEGERIAIPLEKVKLFPGMVVRMIDVGEQTGALPNMLKRIARNYEEEVERTLESLISLIEPLMIVFLAVVVGGIVLALFLPLIKIIECLGV